MTAGDGVNHSEMFPLVNKDRSNTMVLFQIWMNLPNKNRHVKPNYVMHWHEKIPKFNFGSENKSKLTLWAGQFKGTKALTPPEKSWAYNEANNVNLWLLEIQAADTFTLESTTDTVNRAIYIVESDSVQVDGRLVKNSQIVLDAHLPTQISNVGSTLCVILVMQGKPINEKIVHRGPFVMGSESELRETIEK